MAGKGHNINKSLLSLIKRVENVEAEQAALGEDKKEIYTEAKALCHDVKAMRKIVAMRKKEREQLREENENVKIMAEAVDPELAEVL